MLILLSPSKTQDFDTAAPVAQHSDAPLLKESLILAKELRKLSAQNISKLMEVSDKIAALNHERFQQFSTPFTPANAKQAAFAFKGDVYDGLDVETLNAKALAFAQNHIRILSGLYGVLRPLDLIQPYRLEMKTKLKNPRGKDLYHFWENRITDALNNDLKTQKNPVIINLASEEYFKAVKPTLLKASLITPQFKEKKGSTYQMIGLFAKRARGMMARYIATQRIASPEALLAFAEDGYTFNEKLSEATKPVFTRG